MTECEIHTFHIIKCLNTGTDSSFFGRISKNNDYYKNCTKMPCHILLITAKKPHYQWYMERPTFSIISNSYAWKTFRSTFVITDSSLLTVLICMGLPNVRPLKHAVEKIRINLVHRMASKKTSALADIYLNHSHILRKYLLDYKYSYLPISLSLLLQQKRQCLFPKRQSAAV